MGERTPHAAWCHGATKAKAKDNAETQRAGRFRRGIPHPPVFCEKRLQADENKGSESEKERQEKPRVRNGLIRLDLRLVDTAQKSKGCEDTFTGGSKEGLNGDTVSGTLTCILPYRLLFVK